LEHEDKAVITDIHLVESYRKSAINIKLVFSKNISQQNVDSKLEEITVFFSESLELQYSTEYDAHFKRIFRRGYTL